jgi:hypothetical protein
MLRVKQYGLILRCKTLNTVLDFWINSICKYDIFFLKKQHFYLLLFIYLNLFIFTCYTLSKLDGI